MPSKDVTALLGEWEGYGVGFVERHEPDEEGAASRVWIELIRRSDVPVMCSGCGQACQRYHDWDERWIRDLPILDAETELLVQRFRVACPVCGPTGNAPALRSFYRTVRRIWKKWLGRRSQRGHIPWSHYARLLGRHPLPRPIVVHSVYRP